MHQALHRRSVILALLLAGIQTGHGKDSPPDRISYNESIRPIFNTSCVGCHGGVKKSAGVSFIYREDALGVSANGNHIIVPGDPEASELIKRVTSEDPRYVMPPAEGDHHNEPLKPEQIRQISEWIRQGAEWEEHWAYIKPERREVTPRQQDWIRTPMDAYVLAKLEQENLVPSGEAPRPQWLRRVTLDLIGLPPTVEEREAFLSDDAPDAYEKVVDGLLASPRYGERWAAMWMDLARYADTQGYEKDNDRVIWPYRDWLIEAFNRDLPYTTFIRDQLAGDMVEKPTTDQITAASFLRLSQTNTEGGTDDEEFRVEAVKDRINTTWVAMQGITFGCVQCHGHPYEPIPHKDYYRFMTYFNSTEDCDQDNDYPHHLIADKPEERQKATDAQLALIMLRRQLNQPGSEEMKKPGQWVQPAYTDLKINGSAEFRQEDGVLLADGALMPSMNYTVRLVPGEPNRTVTSLKVTILPDSDKPEEAPFRGAHLSHLTLKKVAASGQEEVPLSYVYADSLTGPLGQDPSAALNPNGNGVGGFPKLFRKREAVFVLKEPVTLKEGETLVVNLASKAQTTGGQHTALRRFQLFLGTSGSWQQLLAREEHASLTKQVQEQQELVNAIKGTQIPVTLERPPDQSRESRLFIGGNRLNRGDTQVPGVPEVLNPFAAPVQTRLDMAGWLTHSENSLAARVFVNRIFYELFGNGIVQTLGDFGSSGLPPTNLPLLDHLAIAFRDEYAWRLKPLLKEMVLSAAYRQDHASTPELSAMDPKNLLLARGPRTRLTAEMIRDHALAVSGLIQHRNGGPSVRPPQPDRVSSYGNSKWENATGPDRYRRALYTFWKRTLPYPSMITFDASAREVCNVRRIPTNTPLQPLVTLNDPVYLECAQQLARRLSDHPEAGLREKFAYGHLLATQREITDRGLDVLESLYRDLVEQYRTTSFANVAESAEGAALVNVASVLLNADTALTK